MKMDGYGDNSKTCVARNLKYRKIIGTSYGTFCYFVQHRFLFLYIENGLLF